MKKILTVALLLMSSLSFTALAADDCSYECSEANQKCMSTVKSESAKQVCEEKFSTCQNSCPQ